MDDTFKAALAKAKSEVERLQKVRDDADLELLRLKNLIAVLIRIETRTDCSNPEIGESFSDIGLTEAIRLVIKKANSPLTAPEIRKILMSNGFAMGSAVHLSTEVNSTLRRLVFQNEVTAISNFKRRHIGWMAKGVNSDEGKEEVSQKTKDVG